LLEKHGITCFYLHGLGKDCANGHRIYTSCELVPSVHTYPWLMFANIFKKHTEKQKNTTYNKNSAI